jgi:hypothetical protein
MAVLDKFVSQKMMIGCRLESDPYTMENAVEYDILAKSPTVSPDIEEYVRKYAVGDFDSFESVMGKRKCDLSFTIDLQGSGTANTPAKWGKLLKGCGFRETTGVAGVDYTKDSGVNKTPLTFYIVFKGAGTAPTGIIVKLRGCMGDVEFLVAKTSEPIQASFKFQGVIVSITDLTAAQIPGLTGHDTTTPPSTLSAQLLYRSASMQANNISMKMNNDVQMLPDFNRAEGFEGAYVVNADPSWNSDPYLALQADRFLWPLATGETGPLSGRLQFWAGSTAVPGNHIQLNAWQAQIKKSHGVGSREGTDMNALEGRMNRGATGAPIFHLTQGSYTGIAGY